MIFWSDKLPVGGRWYWHRSKKDGLSQPVFIAPNTPERYLKGLGGEWSGPMEVPQDKPEGVKNPVLVVDGPQAGMFVEGNGKIYQYSEFPEEDVALVLDISVESAVNLIRHTYHMDSIVIDTDYGMNRYYVYTERHLVLTDVLYVIDMARFTDKSRV